MSFLVYLMGGLGAATRFVVDGILRTRFGRQFPWATMIINITGSLILGLLCGLATKNNSFSELHIILGVGFCGGYTTFSTASYESVRLIEKKSFKAATMYTLVTLVLCIIAAMSGMLFVEAFLR